MSAPWSRAAALALAAVCAGCGAARYFPKGDDMKAFLEAGPVLPELDREALLRAIPPAGTYRLGTGDLLEIRGPRALFAHGTDVVSPPVESEVARVDGDGNIQVPLAGTVAARGRTMIEVEAAVAAAVFPRFLVAKPAIVVRVVDYAREQITVVGAVETPGIHELRSDQMTLYGALSASGGILKSNNLVVGARRIRVRRASSDQTQDVVLPVKGLNVPFTDVKLGAGDVIEVERYEPDTFTVVGLVTKPGAYEYPPEVTYNLMQAIAVAGGVDRIADPPYATVFRKSAQGQILPATFTIYGSDLVEASALAIKPGDVIAIEHTAVTWTRSLLAQVLNIQFGYVAGRH
jgi:protein involved in polysaccharide export with SLBB domain